MAGLQLTFPHRETWLHRVNPGIKLVVSVLLFAAVIATHNLNAMVYFSAFALLPLLLFSGHPPLRLLLYTSPFLLIFVSSSTGMMMFGEGTKTWFSFGLIHVTEESYYRGLHLGFRALHVASVGLLFALTTKPVGLFYSLMRQWKLPPQYAYSFLAAFRMAPAVLEEFQTLRAALKVRGAGRRRSRNPLVRIYAGLRMYTVPLMAGAIRRAHRTAAAMEAKGFSMGRARTYYYETGYSALDALYVLYFAAALVLSWRLGSDLPLFPAADVR